MLNYLIRRINLFFITAFILTIIAFVLTNWSNGYTPTTKSNYIFRYFEYISSILQGEWGVSAIDHESILTKGLTAFTSTLELCFVGFFTAIVIAMPLGVLASLNRKSIIDYLIMTVAFIGLALPVFWLATITSLLPWLIGLALPIDGDISPIFEIPVRTGFLLIDTLLAADSYGFDAFYSRLAHLFLPSIVLSIFLISEIIRLTRHTVTMVMKSNYIKAAYAKGFSRRQIIFRHVINNALPPIIHHLRLQLNTIISFAMVIEIVFSMQGTGSWLLISIKEGDYLALPTAVLIISIFILLASLFVDILLISISPVKRKSLYVD